jgi:outer membrane protein OmpA-like peptidoglycan-associated protein
MRTTMNTKLVMLLGLVGLASCAGQQLVTADKAYDRMAYSKAACSYEKVLDKRADREAAIHAADSYQQLNNLEKTIKFYRMADGISPLNGEHALRYAQALQGEGRWDEASAVMARVLADKQDDPMVASLNEALSAHQRFYVDSSLYTVRPLELGPFTAVFSATPYQGGLLFAGERPASGSQVNPWNGASFLDLYTSKASTNGQWSAPELLKGEVNGRFHDGPAVISPDGRSLYFTRSDYHKFRLNKDGGSTSHLMLYRAERMADGGWGNIHQFAFNGGSFSTGHAAVSRDGSALYFISDRPGGLGGTDIYRSTKAEEGWSEPENLGPTVNTAGNEMFPTLQGDTLLFSSNGHAGLGGLDIFRSRQVEGVWTAPENLNYPINTTNDDFSLIMLANGQHGFLSSNRTGQDRIHRFTENDPVLRLVGTFTEAGTGLPMAGAEVRLTDLTSGETRTLMTGADGTYAFDLAKGHDLRVQGSKGGMFTENSDLSTKGQRTDRTYIQDFALQEVVIDKPMVVENIYYDYDEWDIRTDAALELNKLARLFIDNPELSFELSSHTDSRASDLYNLVLSEARAKSAVDHLIRQGVDPDRITAKGWGEKSLVNRCGNDVECSEDEHQANRRTEFKVTRYGKPTP